MAKKWYYICDRKKVGPVSLEQLQKMLLAGESKETDMVLAEGAQKWVPLSAAMEEIKARRPKPSTVQPVRICPRCSTPFPSAP